MNNTNKLITLIFSTSLVANATGGVPQNINYELLQSESRNYKVEITQGKSTTIGKVYEDLNGDGYQADATARHIVIKGGVSKGSYIPGTTTINLGEDIKKAGDHLTEDGIEVEELKGISKQNNYSDQNKAIIRFETTDINWEPVTITTKEGTNIKIDSRGRDTEKNSNRVERGLAGENLKVTRNVYRQRDKDSYIQEIIVENLGIYEEGIPGVKLISVNGVVVETDIYGRYHIPDEWVVRKDGKNIILKVDEKTLPKGMRVVSENPRVESKTSESLSKINFTVQDEKQEEKQEARGDGNE